jgi:hypothetical protein
MDKESKEIGRVALIATGKILESQTSSPDMLPTNLSVFSKYE